MIKLSVWSSVVVAIALVGCEGTQQQPPAAVPSPSSTGPATTNTAHPEGSASGGSVEALAPTTCASYRKLPLLAYTQNTLVQDACITIPDDTTIKVASGVTLVIAATNGLQIGKNVRFVAVGTDGTKGPNGKDHVDWNPGDDKQIKAACKDNGNQCKCPGDDATLEALAGKPGTAGTVGGSVRIIANDIVSASALSGLSLVVAGGAGGPPGESGHQECKHSGIQCSSPACTQKAHAGPSAAAGRVYVAVGGPKADVARKALSGAVSPQVDPANGASTITAAMVVDTRPALNQEITKVNTEATAEHWDRRSGS